MAEKEADKWTVSKAGNLQHNGRDVLCPLFHYQRDATNIADLFKGEYRPCGTHCALFEDQRANSDKVFLDCSGRAERRIVK